MTHIERTVRVGDKELKFSLGHIAKQAAGSTLVSFGDSSVLATVCVAKEPRPGMDFMPLTVDYIEKTFAAGRIPGGFYKREGRPRDHETLISRIIDRSLRPLFPKTWRCETQVVATVLSYDADHPTDVSALVGASLALSVSEIPFAGPIAAVRVGRVDGHLVANPGQDQRERSDIDLIVSCSRSAITMVEGGANEVPESAIVDALLFAHETCLPLIEFQESLRAEIGKTKREPPMAESDPAIAHRVSELATPGLKVAMATAEKAARADAFDKAKNEVVQGLKSELGEEAFAAKEKLAKGAYGDLKYNMVRSMIVETGRRLDGRGTKDIRPILCEVGTLPRVHGSALFQRGETQAIVTATLGTSQDEQKLDTLAGFSFNRFLLHYNFPPYSVGETKPLRSPGRREIGHGKLAERALELLLPSQEAFPYTVRIVSEITESNGSSSMATVCGATLALMDGGVPLKSMAAGIAMGLIEHDGKIAILSDILGDEDHLGDMDFKVCGTRNGVTAVQMDIKLTGVSRETLERALDQAREGRLHILNEMSKTIDAPRAEISKWAPRITKIKVKTERIKDVIGPGGKVIKDLVAKTGASIDIADDGTISIASADSDMVEKAIRLIKDITREPEVGKIYLGNVRKCTDFGAFVEIFPGTDGLVHISDLAEKRVNRVEDVVREGDEVLVKVINIDRQGKIRLSRKEAIGQKASID
ncbi:MAG: polyribonucleotide nucleotidyltransferase [Deltaproteobacteria bacterium]|nr:polyribonucleotide nucleotidyltransferase [Deltaproteobacteria bacterium]